MFGLNNLKVYWKLRILMAMATVGLGIFAWVAFSTLQTVEVNGPLYQRIDNAQNVASDIVPPDLNVTGVRLIVYRAIAETERAKREAVLSELPKLRKNFDESYARDA